MEKNLEKIIEMIWFLTLNFGRNHPESFVPEDAIIEDNLIYNCSYGKFVYDIGEVVYGVGDVRLQTSVNDETSHIQVYVGRNWSSPDKLVLDYLAGDEMTPELKFDGGRWEQMILKEYELRTSCGPRITPNIELKRS